MFSPNWIKLLISGPVIHRMSTKWKNGLGFHHIFRDFEEVGTNNEGKSKGTDGTTLKQ